MNVPIHRRAPRVHGGRSRLQRLVVVGAVLASGLLAAAAPAGASTPLSADCTFLNSADLDGSYTSFEFLLLLGDNEQINVQATDLPDGAATLHVSEPGFSIDLVTPPDDPTAVLSVGLVEGMWTVRWAASAVSDPSFVPTWSVSCGLRGSVDGDGDGVNDGDDACADTDATAGGSKKDRYDADASGAFVGSDGRDSLYTIIDTRGCSASQIAAALGIGDSHARYGVPIGVLKTWVG